MSTLFDLYEARVVPVTHPMIAKAWAVIGGQHEYRVELTVRGEWTCSCPAFRFQSGGGRLGCKHTKFVAVASDGGSRNG